MIKRALALVAFSLVACAKNPESTETPTPAVQSIPAEALPGHGSLAQDHTPKEGPRLLPAEVYIQTYLDIFSTLSPLSAELASRGKDGSALFDTWREYLASLGIPDYEKDIGRVTQTNAMMLATFERIGIALCDRAVERELKTAGIIPVDKRTVFAFDLTAAEPTAEEFATRFDVLHRTFLGYPASLAPSTNEGGRIKRFYDLYTETVTRHKATTAPKIFTPSEAGWAAVCYGLVRHPEFHTY